MQVPRRYGKAVKSGSPNTFMLARGVLPKELGVSQALVDALAAHGIIPRYDTNKLSHVGAIAGSAPGTELAPGFVKCAIIICESTARGVRAVGPKPRPWNGSDTDWDRYQVPSDLPGGRKLVVFAWVDTFASTADAVIVAKEGLSQTLAGITERGLESVIDDVTVCVHNVSTNERVRVGTEQEAGETLPGGLVPDNVGLFAAGIINRPAQPG